jgi:hypothetical protein
MRITRLFLLLFFSALPLFATTRYVATGAGTFSGGSACNGQTAITRATWQSTSESPGDITYLCGTVTGTAGDTGLSINWSGSSGNPIQFIFDTGSSLQAPYWGATNSSGALNLNGVSYVTINGGTNGIIENTANGSSTTYNQGSEGIHITGSSYITIENLSILNLFVNSITSLSAGGGIGINLFNSVSNHIFIHDNILTWDLPAVQVVYPGSSTMSDIEIYNNTVTHSGTAVIVGEGNTSAVLNGLTIHDNSFAGGGDFWDTGDVIHLNHMHIYAVASGDTITGVQIYNNYLYGDFGGDTKGAGHQTASIFLEAGPGTIPSPQVFNNVIAQTTPGDYAADGLIYFKGITGSNIYNNTLIGSGAGTGISLNGGSTPVVVENNVIDNFDEWVYSDGTITTADHNDYYLGGRYFAYNSTNYNFAGWQGLGFDTNGSSGNPNLSGTYTLGSGSAAIGLGANLTSAGITALDSDKAAVARPSSGAWDAGAYQYGSSPTLTSITVAPSSASISTTGTQQFTATCLWSDSTTVCPTLTWASSLTGIATISSSGLATAVSAGSSTITAVNGGVTSNGAALTVSAAVGGFSIMTGFSRTGW